MKTNNSISIVIICFNEEKTIDRAISTALKVTANVIVVDSFSEDSTPAICKKYPVKFIQRKWQGYGNQRNFGAEMAPTDIIFSLDADEAFSEDLINELKDLKNFNDRSLGVFKRKNFIHEAEVKFGSWGRDKVTRLYNKKYATWNSDLVHEDIKCENSKPLLFKSALHHYVKVDKILLKQKVENYSNLAAERMLKNNKKASLFKTYFNPFFKFAKEYIFYGGFLDGKNGFKIAKMNAIETHLKYKKLKSLQEKNQSS